MTVLYFPTCPTCEQPTSPEEFNVDANECEECHYESPLSYDECGCDACWQKLVAKVDFMEFE
jgi:hypothetical protein